MAKDILITPGQGRIDFDGGDDPSQGSIYLEVDPDSSVNFRGSSGDILQILDEIGGDLFRVINDSDSTVFRVVSDGSVYISDLTEGYVYSSSAGLLSIATNSDILSRLDEDSAGLTFDGVSVGTGGGDSLWQRTGDILSPLNSGDHVLIENNSFLYLGTNQESFIYYDSQDLRIGFANPSAGPLTQKVRINDDLLVEGYLGVDTLSPNSGVYTDGYKNLTTTAPVEGTIGFWSRTGATLSPVNSGDDITTTGDISCTDLDVSGTSQLDDLVTIGDGTTKGLELRGTGNGSGEKGGYVGWHDSSTDTPTGWTFINSNNQLVFSNATQSIFFDTGNAWIDFDDGSASFAQTNFTIASNGDVNIVGDIKLDSNSNRLYFGTNQESYIYYDSQDLRIGFANPSAGPLTQKVRINDDLLVEGYLAVDTLSPNSAVSTDGNKNLISTDPTGSGSIGFWSRAGTTLSPVNSGDDITTTGDISCTDFDSTGDMTGDNLTLQGDAGPTPSNVLDVTGGAGDTLGGGISLVGGTASFGGGVGGAITLTGGAGIDTVALPGTSGGAVNLTGGDGGGNIIGPGTGGDGGALTLTAGDGGNNPWTGFTAGDGGDVDITAGSKGTATGGAIDGIDGVINLNSDTYIPSNSNRLYFGTGQESSIYFDGTDLNITLNDPSQAGVINLTDTLNVKGHIDPTHSCQYDIGSSTNRWNDFYYCGEIYDTSGKTLDERYVDRAFVNGTFRESFDFRVVSSGSTIYGTLTNADNPSHGNLTMQFSDGDTEFEAPVIINLTAGSDSSPTENYVYITQDDKTNLQVDTNNWPTTEHIKVAYLFLQSAPTVAGLGSLVNQNWNDHLSGSDNVGHLVHITEHIRVSGAVWHNGVDPAGDNGDTDGLQGYLRAGAGNSMYLASGAGFIYQLHRHAFPAFDSENEVAYIVNQPNDEGGAYTPTNDLNADVTHYDNGTDAGGLITSAQFFNLVIWGVANKTGEHTILMINLPTGTYGTYAAAIADSSSYDNYTIPRAFLNESSTGFLIARITIQLVASAWDQESTVDLRGSQPNAAGQGGGGGGGGGTTFVDNTFAIYDEGDVTKQITFQASGIGSGNTSELTIPDRDIDLGSPVFDTITLGDTDSPPASLTMTFNTDSTDGTIVYTGATDQFDFGSSNLITTGNINLDSNSARLYFGTNQESFIYYDSSDLRIGFANPSIGALTQTVRINDDLLVEGLLTTNSDLLVRGLLTVGSTIIIDGDNRDIYSTDVGSEIINIAKDRTGDGTAVGSYLSGFGVEFFKNADFYAGSHSHADNENPVLAFYGGGSSGQKYGFVGIDDWGRMIFGGTVSSVVFNKSMDASQGLLIGGNSTFFINRGNNIVSGSSDYMMLYGYTSSSNLGRNDLRFVDYNNRTVDYNAENFPDPTFSMHSGSTSDVDAFLRMWHDGTDGIMSVGTGILTTISDFNILDNSNVSSTENLDETDFATHAKWDVTGDFDDTGGNATYVHSTGSGTLTQTSANMANALEGSKYYVLTYTVTNYTNTSFTAHNITTGILDSAKQIPVYNGTHSIVFKTKSSPGDFVISVTSNGTCDFTIDDISIKEIVGGSIYCGATEMLSFTQDGDISIPSNTNRLYFGTNQESFIYYDSSDLRIGFSDPSAGLLTQKVWINDDLMTSGIFTVGEGSIYMEADPARELNFRGSSGGGQLVKILDRTGIDLFKVFDDGGIEVFTISNGGVVNIPDLAVTSAVYTDGSSNLTTTAPTEGTVGYWSKSETVISPATADDSVSLNSNTSRLYFGENQESFIYYDSQDLRIGFTNPSIGPLTQTIRINDDLLVEGQLTVGTNSIVIDGDEGTIEINGNPIALPPIGAIIAWDKTPSQTPSIPEGWVECNGQTISDTKSVYNGVTIKNLNGSGGGTKRFIRGSTTSGTEAGALSHTHSIACTGTTCSSITFCGVTTGYTGCTTTVQSGFGATVASCSHGHTYNVCGYLNPHTHSVPDTDTSDHLPQHIEMVYIMRIK
jgi:hypothetical protein